MPKYFPIVNSFQEWKMHDPNKSSLRQTGSRVDIKLDN